MLAIELNGCSGGMAEGFRRAGITFTWCFDWDPDACASYEHNLGHRPVRMDIRDLVRMARGGWSPGEVDLLVADPPCTPWSRAGKRQGVADERDMLEETCELIGLLRPRAFLIGNIPGLQDSTSWHIVQRVIGGLGRHGYCVADYAQLDAADYGVPQRRIRPFWFGHLAGPCLVWPAPTHAAPTATAALPGLALQPWVTCRQALAQLPPEEMGRPVRLRWKNDLHPPSTFDEPSKVVPASMPGNGGAVIVANAKDPPCNLQRCSTERLSSKPGPGDGSLLVNGRHQPAEPDAPAPTVAAKVRSQGAQVLRALDESHGHPTSKLDAPAWTLTAEGGRAGKRASVVEGWPWDRRLGHPNAIVLSERAAAILQGFPEGWLFSGKTKRARWSQIGQAMPPALAEAVARSIARQMQAAGEAASRRHETQRLLEAEECA